MERTHVLVAIPVFNGQDFVPRCIASAMRLDRHRADIDVLVLDDCSPAPGWSTWLAGYCKSAGAYYYRNPVNIGIVRNFNLGFRCGVEEGYDYVLIANSDTIMAHDMVGSLIAAAETSASIGSVTAWSNNVSLYSIPNECSEESLGDPAVVDWIGGELAGEFGDAVVDVPAGTGFALFVPTRVFSDLGYLDNVFDRGYCEETDWTLRSLEAGYRAVLGLGAFAYHMGGASTRAAGLIGPTETSVDAHEAIIDLRYPRFREQCDAFLASASYRAMEERALHRLVASAASQWGYNLEMTASGSTPRAGHEGPRPLCLIDTANPHQVCMRYRGFSKTYSVGWEPTPSFLLRMFHSLPSHAAVPGTGAAADDLAGHLAAHGVPVQRTVGHAGSGAVAARPTSLSDGTVIRRKLLDG